MSLRVWLPLNGNLNNQGCSSVTVTNSGATVDSSGKIGSCYRFNKNSYLSIPASAVTGSAECSFSLWLKINSFNAAWDTYVQIGKGGQAWTDYRMGLLRNNTNSNLVFAISDGSSSSQQSFTTSNITTGVWNHIACVYKSGHCLIYINGTLYSDNTTSIVPKFSDVTSINVGGLASYYKTDSYINDFRIYDHALSAKEVKEISKGLIVHYPLDGSGKGNDNLVPNCSQYNSLSTALTRTSASVDGWYWVPGTHFIVEPSTTYTFSVCCDGTLASGHGASTDPSVKSFTMWLYLCNSNTTKDYNNGGYDSPINFNSSNYNHKQIGNKHIWQYTTTSSQTHMSIRVNTYSNGTDATTVKFWQIKVEKGSEATPWCPNSSDSSYSTLGYNSTLEIDVSGFKYHGTRNGTLTQSSDTAKYSCSTLFADGKNNYIFAPIQLGDNKNFTMNIWLKSTDGSVGTGSYHIISCINGNQYEFSIPTDGKFRSGFVINGTRYCDNYGSVNLLNKNWHMITATYDGSNIKRYVDGQLVNTQAVSGTLSIGSLTLWLGRYANDNNYGDKNILKSDFRLYATALSADNIKELYQNSVSIANNGSVLCYELEEV